ncbi:MAG: MerC domain-containing protein [Luteolibacter sp.]
MITTTFPEPPNAKPLNADRLGVLASVLCAIHCAAAPVLLLALPTFGRIWAHPATHWGMAILVVPIAAAMACHGFRRHRRKWVAGFAALGILFVIVGGALPYLEFGKNTANGLSIPLPGTAAQATEQCTDSCCPSAAEVSGNNVLHIPPAAIATTLGGIALIITHLGNLCACRACRPPQMNASPTTRDNVIRSSIADSSG